MTAIDPTTLELPARRAWLRAHQDTHAPAPFSSAALRAWLRGEGRWADVEGIGRAERERLLEGARRLAARGRHRSARDVLRYLAEIDPLDCRYALALGAIALERDEWEAAEACFSDAIARFGGDIGGYAGRAVARFRGGDAPGALEDAAAALAHDPDAEHPSTRLMARVLADRR